MNLISNDWKHLLRPEMSQKSFLKSFYYNNKSIRKVKDSNKSYNKPFKFVSWPHFPEGNHIPSPEIWDKTFTDRFNTCADGYRFCNPVILRMDNAPNIRVANCKKLVDFKCNFVSHFNKLIDTAI